MKTISAGVIIINDKNEILACEVYGKNHEFDIPKGKVEDGESEIDTALRELKEETDLTLNKSDLIEIGLKKYNSKKDLFLFYSSVFQ